MATTLKEFLQSGELGPIHAGMSQAEVTAQLGKPEDVSVGHPQILKYGGLQLTFLRKPGDRDRRLAHIGLYFGPDMERIPPPLLPTDFHGTPNSTIAEVRDFLARAGMKESAVVEGEGTNYLILPSGARITFDGEKLHSVIFATPSTSLKKQLSFSIPKDTWCQLKALSQKLNCSVSELCAEWITQRAAELQGDKNAKVLPEKAASFP